MSFGCFGNLHIGIFRIYSAVWFLSLNIRFEILVGTLICSYSLFIMFLCMTCKIYLILLGNWFLLFLAILNSTVENIFEDIFWCTQGYFH